MDSSSSRKQHGVGLHTVPKTLSHGSLGSNTLLALLPLHVLVNGLTTMLSGVSPAHLDFSGPIVAKLKCLTQELMQEFDFLV